MNECFQFTQLPATPGMGVYRASKINEYQKEKNNVSGEKSAAGL
jgi:hypothetical protein